MIDSRKSNIYDWLIREQRVNPKTGVAWSVLDIPTDLPLTLDQYKQKKINELNNSCNATILSTFTSSCLGVSHTYSFSYDSQMNLAGTLAAMNAGISPATVSWKTEDAGAFTHTVAQFKQLFADGMTFKQTNIYRYRALKDQVNACTTQADIDAIVW